MFELDVRSRKPIYEQLVDKIKGMIVTQVLKPDEKLPSVRMLSKELTVNPNTIQKAYRELERQGYVYSIPAKGSFVAPVESMPSNEKLLSLEKNIVKLITEAIYLGLTKENLNDLYEEAKERIERGIKDDSN